MRTNCDTPIDRRRVHTKAEAEAAEEEEGKEGGEDLRTEEFSLDSIRGCARFGELSALEKRLCVALMIMPEDFIRIRGMIADKVAAEERSINEKAQRAAEEYATAALAVASTSGEPALPPVAAALVAGQRLKAEKLKVDVVRTGRKLSLRVDVAFATAKPSGMATLPGPLVPAAAAARARAAAAAAAAEAEAEGADERKGTERKAAELRPTPAHPAVAATAAAAARGAEIGKDVDVTMTDSA